MASAIAAFLMLPHHSSMIASQAMPLATWSSTSLTKIRVPRNVGLPWQMDEFTTMYRPRDFRNFRSSPTSSLVQNLIEIQDEISYHGVSSKLTGVQRCVRLRFTHGNQARGCLRVAAVGCPMIIVLGD